jgi:hypothetical protein
MGRRAEYYQSRRESQLRRLWDAIQNGDPEGGAHNDWEHRQATILRERFFGRTWEDVLEATRRGPLEDVK